MVLSFLWLVYIIWQKVVKIQHFDRIFFLCVCICMCFASMFVYMPLYMSAHAWGKLTRETKSLFAYGVFPLNPEITPSTTLASQSNPQIPCLVYWVLRLWKAALRYGIYMGSGDQNLGPYACTASILLTVISQTSIYLKKGLPLPLLIYTFWLSHSSAYTHWVAQCNLILLVSALSLAVRQYFYFHHCLLI